MPAAAAARLNLRIAPDALATIREAAAAQQQDVTSFVLGAAMDRARAVVRDWHVTRLTIAEAERLEAILDREPPENPELLALLREVGKWQVGPDRYDIPRADDGLTRDEP